MKGKEGKLLSKEFLQKGYLIETELLELFEKIGLINSNMIELILSLNPPRIISKNFFISNIREVLERLGNFEQSVEKINEIKKRIAQILGEFEIKKVEKKEIKEESLIVEAFNVGEKEIVVEDFVDYFRSRYNILKNYFLDKVKNITSIGKIAGQRKNISLVGLVYDKRITKNKNILLVLEDPTGMISVLINKEKKEIYEKAREITLDEVIAVTGSGSKEIFFVNEIFFPDIFTEEKKIGEEEAVAFISDLHIGSTSFLEKNFLKFIDWINGKIGSERQKELAKKIKYLFVVGDVVAGIGVYPGQKEELVIDDIKEQFKKAAELFSLLRKDLKIIICPGNHDGIRLLEPQPAFDEKYARPLFELENTILVSNPALVKIKGINFLIYHGAAYDYYLDMDVMKERNAKMNPEQILTLLIKKRHLAPTHGSTRYFPVSPDPLIIKNHVDVLVTGHLHRPGIANYNGVKLIACSCWQPISPYQEKQGHEPDPCKVPVLNLKTGKIDIFDFS